MLPNSVLCNYKKVIQVDRVSNQYIKLLGSQILCKVLLAFGVSFRINSINAESAVAFREDLQIAFMLPWLSRCCSIKMSLRLQGKYIHVRDIKVLKCYSNNHVTEALRTSPKRTFWNKHNMFSKTFQTHFLKVL